MKQVAAIVLLASICWPSLAAPAPKPRPKAAPPTAAVDPLERDLQWSLSRFPTLDDCNAWIDFAGQHYRWAWNCSLLYRWEREEWQEYALWVYSWRNVWISLRIARDPFYSLGCRLEEFANVREAIGEADFWLGYVPVPVNVRMLPRID